MKIEEIFPNPMDFSSDCIAIGGNLNPKSLISAYAQGIFPWYNEGEEIHWYSPDPRFILYPSEVKISKSMRKYFNQEIYHITYNQSFEEVINHCQSINRNGQDGTWITQAMKKAYTELNQQGIALSVEVWDKQNQLVGGLYGIDLNNVFFGESMFSLNPNASKFAFINLCKKLEKENYKLIDCQIYTNHLASLGGHFIPKKEFIEMIKKT